MDNTNSLVILKGKVPFTNSLVIAEGTDNEHRAVMQLIRKYEERFNRWGAVRFTHLKCQNPLGGRPTTIAFLNEQQATFLITLLKNTDIVLDFKAELVDQFYKMREVLNNKQNSEWLEKRKMNKLGNREMADSLKNVVELAERQGSKNGSKIYLNVQRLQNKIIGVSAGQRDQLEIWQMNALDTLQFIAKTIATGLVAQGADWHQVYKDIKAAYENYSRLAFIEQRQEQQVHLA